MAPEPATRETDPELESLPEPRRPFRRLTLATMLVTLAASLWTALGLLPSARYALSYGVPTEVSGPLDDTLDNRWVHLRGAVDPGAVEYRRPLDPDHFRLAPLSGMTAAWVEMRVPSDMDRAYFVPPTSFVGRLVKVESAGLRHAELAAAFERATGRPLPPGAWLLIDGEAPGEMRWVLGVVALLFAFAAFNLWGVVHLSRPVRDG